MKHSIIIEEEALEEINDAYRWYEHQKKGLGENLLDSLDKLYEYIDKFPNANPQKYQQQRQAILAKFPYVIMYKIENNCIVIYAVFHTSRNPLKKYRK